MWSWLAVSLSGIGAIAGTKHGHIGQALVYKVFTFVLLAVVAVTQSIVAEYTYWIVAGLAISAVADVLHTVTQNDRFILSVFYWLNSVIARHFGYNSQERWFGGCLRYC